MSELNEQLRKALTIDTPMASLKATLKSLRDVMQQIYYNDDEKNLGDFIREGFDEVFPVAATPAPQAAPSGWKDALYADMDRAFSIRETQGSAADGGMVIDDTQIGVEFAMNWVEKHFAPAVTQAAPSEPVGYIDRDMVARLPGLSDKGYILSRITKVPSKGCDFALYAAPLAAQQSPADARDAVLLEKALSDLIDVAEQCDSWESFPRQALEAARAAIAAATTSTEGR